MQQQLMGNTGENAWTMIAIVAGIFIVVY